MNQTLKVSIIVINYNGSTWIRKCLDSLFSQTHKNIEVVVVDNDSKDDSNDIIKHEYPNTIFHQMGTNTGFATAVNKGVELSTGEYIVLFNLDAWIDNTMVEKLLQEKIERDLDVIAPMEYSYEKQEIRSARSSTVIDFLGHPANISQSDSNFFLLGACILFKKELYLQTGGLDGDFFMYCEEVDWFWRLHLQGKKIGYSYSQKLYHKGAGSTGTGIKYNTFLWRNQNTPQMLIKNYRWYNLLWVLPMYLLINIVEMVFFLFLRKPKISLSYLQGLWYNIVNLPKTLNKRKLIQKLRIKSDNYILSRMYHGFGKLRHLLVMLKKKV
jgi:GT2 family glycosyltransferase